MLGYIIWWPFSCKQICKDQKSTKNTPIMESFSFMTCSLAEVWKLHALWKHDAQKTQTRWLPSTTCSPENDRPSPSWSSSSLAVDVSAPSVARRRPGRLSRPEGRHPNARRGRKNCGEKSTCPHQGRKSTSESTSPKQGNTQYTTNASMCQRWMNGQVMVRTCWPKDPMKICEDEVRPILPVFHFPALRVSN